MLTRLIIRNYAIIPALDLSLENGLSVITGETGAGKSILLGALGLALGKRADSRVLQDKDNKCIVEAHFNLKDQGLKEIFAHEGLDFDKDMICRREITSGGKSRSFINDTPVSLKVLQEITGTLIELHQQHDNISLQWREYQVHVLDVLSGSTKIFHLYKSMYSEVVREKNELERLKEADQSSLRRKDFLEFQIQELENAQLKSGELPALEETQKILQHGEAIEGAIRQLQNILNNGPHSIHQQLIQLGKHLDAVKEVSKPLSAVSDRIESLRIEVQDIVMDAGRLEGLGKEDPSQLAKIDSRLNQLYSLIKKYQTGTVDQLLDLLNALKHELNELSSMREQIAEKENEIKNLERALKDKGQELSKARKKGIKKILPKINSLIHDLGMPNGKFSIQTEEMYEPGPNGMDEIDFIFSANKGVAMQSLQVVASGGELSRLSLAMKSLYARQAELPTIIFDEIDTGISGEVAWRMGQLIQQLAAGHQIIMITHSPQIAAHARLQYHVSKNIVNGRDSSSVKLLSMSERITEIAKMLSGDPPSNEAMANAKSLLSSAKNPKS